MDTHTSTSDTLRLAAQSLLPTGTRDPEVPMSPSIVAYDAVGRDAFLSGFTYALAILDESTPTVALEKALRGEWR